MALIAAQKGSGGGGGTETVLWTNPSSSSDFAAQTVTLGQSIANFRYIGILFKDTTTTSDSSSDNITIYLTPDDWRKSVIEIGKSVPVVASRTSGASYFRSIMYVSDTSFSFSMAFLVNASGSSNSYAIPVKIFGV